jgi:hypothetical protein
MNLLVNFKRVAMAWAVSSCPDKRQGKPKSHSMQMSNQAAENQMLAPTMFKPVRHATTGKNPSQLIRSIQYYVVSARSRWRTQMDQRILTA